MRYQKLPEPEEKMFYSSPVHPTIYKLRTNNSSQRVLFHYSVIETDPVSYEPGLTPGPMEYTDMHTDSRCYDQVAEEYTDISAYSRFYDQIVKVDITMKEPDAYIVLAGKLTESSDTQQSGKKT